MPGRFWSIFGPKHSKSAHRSKCMESFVFKTGNHRGAENCKKDKSAGVSVGYFGRRVSLWDRRSPRRLIRGTSSILCGIEAPNSTATSPKQGIHTFSVSLLWVFSNCDGFGRSDQSLQTHTYTILTCGNRISIRGALHFVLFRKNDWR